ncbi:MAG: hypothetical protein EI684_16875 [Candidatus Viridilinea halotolerans]|uniref:Addiction module protein n=1 Tax=Candidatus Viridilinea halotolerans TaxID=2491704 RepID=A0A426TUZ3_9CHLR|nr:MAG: hypothetical protein EI684_16875 [Candidatus Viridilinea halotolerans]
MSRLTLADVLTQARQLPLAEQARLTTILDRERSLRLVALLDEWAADESGYEDEAWPQLQATLDAERERLGMSRLFADRDHSV